MDRIIVQRHKLGCGVACVAYVLRFGYSKALRLFNQPENAAVMGYWCRDIVAALATGKIDYVHRYFKARHRKILTAPGVNEPRAWSQFIAFMSSLTLATSTG